jgi:hypothetical protein
MIHNPVGRGAVGERPIPHTAVHVTISSLPAETLLLNADGDTSWVHGIKYFYAKRTVNRRYPPPQRRSLRISKQEPICPEHWSIVFHVEPTSNKTIAGKVFYSKQLRKAEK